MYFRWCYLPWYLQTQRQHQAAARWRTLKTCCSTRPPPSQLKRPRPWRHFHNAKSLWHEHGRGKFIKFWLGYFSVSTESRAFGQMATLYHVICIWVVMWSCQTVRSPSYIMLISVIESSIGVLLPECSILEAETTFCNDLSGLVSDSYASMPDSMAAFQPVSAEAIDGKKLLDVFSWGSPYHAKGKQESVS